jgi:hypothetical protein
MLDKTDNIGRPYLKVINQTECHNSSNIELLLIYSSSIMKSNDLSLSDNGTSAVSRKSTNCIPYFEVFDFNGSNPVLSGKSILKQQSFFS